MPAVLFNRAMPLKDGSSPTAPLDASTTPKTSNTLSTHSSPAHISEHTRKIVTAVLASTLLVMLVAVVGTVIYRRFWKQRVSAKREATQQSTPTTQVVLPYSHASARSSQDTLAAPPSLKDGKRWEAEMS